MNLDNWGYLTPTLGLVMKRGLKVERLTEGRANRLARGVETLAPQLAGFCYRPQPQAD